MTKTQCVLVLLLTESAVSKLEGYRRNLGM